MSNIIFLGTEFKKGKGGVASVLNEYSKIFPKATFISTTASNGSLKNIIVLIIAIIKLPFILTFNRSAIVHIHGASYNSFFRKHLFFKIISFFGNKVIYHIHGAEFHEFYKNASKKGKHKIAYLINNVACVICLSPEWKIFFEENFHPNKIKIIPNIVEEPIVTKENSGNEFSFLFLGHVSERKGIWLLLEALEALKDELLLGKFTFYIGGNGEVDLLKKIIKEKKLESIVKFIGWVTAENKKEYLNKANAYILPSYNEGLPISILEAMTYSLPIIATNVGGIPQVVVNRVNGLLIEPGNLNELKKAIKFAIENQEVFKSYGKESLKLVETHLPKNVKKELEQLYNTIY